MSSHGTAVVTGASSGIGEAAAHQLAAAGFDVVLGARRVDRLEKVAEAIGTRARAHALDVTDPASVDRFCDLVESCRLLVNNAGARWASSLWPRRTTGSGGRCTTRTCWAWCT